MRGTERCYCPDSYEEPEPIEDDVEPRLTDADAPERDAPVDWLPDGMDTGTYGEEVNEETRSLMCGKTTHYNRLPQ